MLNIGITCAVDPDDSFNVFSNSLRQTTFFFYRLFKSHGHQVKLVVSSDSQEEPGDDEIALTKVDRNDLAKFDDHDLGLDVLLIVGCKLSKYQLGKMRDLNPWLRVILYKGYDAPLQTMQNSCKPVNQSESYEDSDWYDQVWIPSHHSFMMVQWAEIMYQVPVKVVPPVWYPLFVPEATLDNYPKKIRVGVFESHSSLNKTAHWSLMALSKVNDPRLGSITVLCSDHIKEDPAFRTFTDRLGFHEYNRHVQLEIRDRVKGPVWMNEQCDLVVTHDLDDSVGHHHFEALYMGYPLVHTSFYLRNFGFYYKRFDAEEGAAAIRKALDFWNIDTVDQVQAEQHEKVEDILLPQLRDYNTFKQILDGTDLQGKVLEAGE